MTSAWIAHTIARAGLNRFMWHMPTLLVVAIVGLALLYLYRGRFR